MQSTCIKILIACGFIACCAVAFGQQINPKTQINWPLITGSGAPSGGACTSANYGQPYLDNTGHVYYVCSAAGWLNFGSGSFNLPAALAASPYSLNHTTCPNGLLTNSSTADGYFGCIPYLTSTSLLPFTLAVDGTQFMQVLPAGACGGLTAQPAPMLVVGPTCINSAMVDITQGYTSPVSGGMHGVGDYATIIAATNAGYATFDSEETLSGSATNNHFGSFQPRQNYNATGGAERIFGIESGMVATATSSGAIGTIYQAHFSDMSLTAGSTVTVGTDVGVKVEPISLGTTNYGFWSVTGGTSTFDQFGNQVVAQNGAVISGGTAYAAPGAAALGITTTSSTSTLTAYGATINVGALLAQGQTSTGGSTTTFFSCAATGICTFPSLTSLTTGSTVNASLICTAAGVSGCASGSLSGMTGGQIPVAATATTVTSSTPYGLTGNSTIVETTSGGLLTPSILPLATSAAFGAVKVDNTTITASAGVISAVAAWPCSLTEFQIPMSSGATGCTNSGEISDGSGNMSATTFTATSTATPYQLVASGGASKSGGVRLSSMANGESDRDWAWLTDCFVGGDICLSVSDAESGNPNAHPVFGATGSASGTLSFLQTTYANCTALTTTSNVLGCTASDARLKSHIFDLAPKDALAFATGITEKFYEFKDPKSRFSDNREHIGLLAQDVEKFPKIAAAMVTTMAPTDATPDGTLAIDYAQVGPIALAAIKELEKQHEEDVSRIQALELRLEKLEAKY